jgi:hypothetical protein
MQSCYNYRRQSATTLIKLADEIVYQKHHSKPHIETIESTYQHKEHINHYVLSQHINYNRAETA